MLLEIESPEVIGAIGLGAIGLALFCGLVVLVLYNKLVGARQRVRESFSGIATELQRRHDLIPNLVSIVKGYAAHEKELFERVTELRNQATEETQRSTRVGQGQHEMNEVRAKLASRERELGELMSKLIVQVEAYPELKADKNFAELMTHVRTTEDRIQACRRFYNANVRELNMRCETFPSGVVARTFGFEQADFFQIEDPLAKIAPKLNLT